MLLGENNLMDDDGAGRWHRSCFSNTDSVFGRIHERLATLEASHLWKIDIIIWASGRGRQSRLRRSRKQDQFHLRYEQNGTIRSAQREIASARGRHLRVNVTP